MSGFWLARPAQNDDLFLLLSSLYLSCRSYRSDIKSEASLFIPRIASSAARPEAGRAL